MEDMSKSAERSAEVAQGSVATAKRGAEAGQNTIKGMDQMREQIQETAKRIKQIGDLGKTIQADTNEAVASMEQATNGVVETTRLADAAGQALGEIESVSEQLSDLILSIPRDAHRQSETATDVSGSMAKIQETTTLTSSGSRQTAESIGKLSDLARELQASVAGFKLPA